MTTLGATLAVLLALAGLAWYLTATARRLDRLHHRVETSRAGLDVELTRRAGAAVELAASGALAPAAARALAAAATGSLDAPRTPAALSDVTAADDAARWQAESVLSRALAGALAGSPPGTGSTAGGGGGGVEEAATARVRDAARRAALARRFHNDAVVTTRRLRAKRLVRWAHLAGRARWPETADFDDGSHGGSGGDSGDEVPGGEG